MDYRFSKIDLRILLIYFAIAIPVGCMDYDDYSDLRFLIVDQISFIILTLLTTYVIVYILFKRFLPKGQFFALILSTTVVLLLMGAIEIQTYCYFYDCKGSPWSLKYIYYGMMNNLDGVGILTVLLLGGKLYNETIRYTELERDKKENELRLLKSQIDPHFLFNNLNTVDSLIDSNPQTAKIYLNKLAQLYRYLISSKDLEVIALSEELEFAKNYMYLIEHRFGDAYQFDILNHLPSHDQLLILPGALQTLLENIVKHNQASSAQPVKSEIIIDDKGVTVRNNLQAKTQKAKSTGIGLNNLRSRYKLLTEKDIHIHLDQNFTVQLPLINEVV